MDYKVQLDNDDHYVGGNTHEYIVVHGTGNWTDTDEGNANYFCSGDRESSAHKFVDDDSVTTLVKDEDCSWSVGDGHGAYGITNRNCLAVEMCETNGQITDLTQANTIIIIKQWMAKYNIPIDRVVRHYDASRKNCPEAFNYDGQWTKWYAFKAKLAGGSAPAQPNTTGTNTTPTIIELQHALNVVGLRDANGNTLVEDGIIGAHTKEAISKCYVRRGDSNLIVTWIQKRLNVSADGTYGNAPYHETYDAIRAYQVYKGLTADGVVGPQTLTAMMQ